MPSANGTVADREAPDAQASNEGVEMASMHMSSLNDQGLLEILMEYAVVIGRKHAIQKRSLALSGLGRISSHSIILADGCKYTARSTLLSTFKSGGVQGGKASRSILTIQRSTVPTSRSHSVSLSFVLASKWPTILQSVARALRSLCMLLQR